MQDRGLLSRLDASTERADVVVLHCASSITDVIGRHYELASERARAGGPGALPPRKLHASKVRVWVKRVFKLSTPSHAPSVPSAVPSLEQARALVSNWAGGAISFAVYAAQKTTIARTASNSGFTLVLEYEHHSIGEACREAFAQAPNSPFVRVAAGTDTFVCGVIRQWPHLGPPTSAELARLRSEAKAPAVLLRPILKEHAFSGEVEFAVPVRYREQLQLLLPSLPRGVKLFKKVRPDIRVCTACWQKGHSRSHCPLQGQKRCKHCGESHAAAPGHPAAAAADPRGACPKTPLDNRAVWPNCLLCSKKGHCATSCPIFKGELVPLNLQPKKQPPSLNHAVFPQLPDSPTAVQQPLARATQPTAAAPTVAQPAKLSAANAVAIGKRTPAPAQASVHGEAVGADGWCTVGRNGKPAKPSYSASAASVPARPSHPSLPAASAASSGSAVRAGAPTAAANTSSLDMGNILVQLASLTKALTEMQLQFQKFEQQLRNSEQRQKSFQVQLHDLRSREDGCEELVSHSVEDYEEEEEKKGNGRRDY